MNPSQSGAVIVTGGSRGIGAAACKAIAALAYPVVVNYASDAGAAQGVVRQIEEAGGKALAVQADVADEQAVAGMFSQAVQAFGRVHALVNNAGITGRIGPFEAASLATVEEVFRINVLGTIVCCQQAIRTWRAAGRGGVVGNRWSVAYPTGSPNEYVHYAASKAAVETLTLGLGKELASSGIRVCAVAPGSTLTGIHAMAGEPDRPQRIAPRIPLGRLAEPEEIAEAIAWLVTPKASYVVGSTLKCTGGL